jgi:membrane protease YdiL (CAAX protease family)
MTPVPSKPHGARPTAGTGFLVLAVGLALVLPSLLAWLGFVTLAGSGQASAGQQLVYSLGKVVQFSLPLLVLFLLDRRRPSLPASLWSGVGIGLGFGLAVAGAMLALYFGVLRNTTLFADTPRQVQQKLRELNLETSARFLILAVFLSAVHSFLEEYYWRWFVFGRLRQLVPWGIALVVSGLAFMAHHVIILAVYLPGWFWAGVLPFSLGIAVGGWVWAWLYDRTGSLLGPWISHLIVDATIFVIGWDLIHRTV